MRDRCHKEHRRPEPSYYTRFHKPTVIVGSIFNLKQRRQLKDWLGEVPPSKIHKTPELRCIQPYLRVWFIYDMSRTLDKEFAYDVHTASSRVT